MLNLPEEEVGARTGLHHFTVNTISHTEPATLDQEFFDRVFGKDQVHSAEELNEKVRETISQNYERESNHLLDHELEAIPGLHYKVDSNHDIVYLEFEEPAISVQDLGSIFAKLGLDARFVGTIPPELNPKKSKTQPIRLPAS